MISLLNILKEIKVATTRIPSYTSCIKDNISNLKPPTKDDTLLTWLRKNGTRSIEFVNSTSIKNTKVDLYPNSPLNMIDWEKYKVAVNNLDREKKMKFDLQLLKYRAKLLEDYLSGFCGPNRIKIGIRTTRLRFHTNVPSGQFKMIPSND